MAYLGEIRLFAGDYAPADWRFCDGTELDTSDWPALYALLGNAYGGNGTSTFALPDMRGRITVGAGKTYSLGARGGSETVTLQAEQLPAHSHTWSVTTDVATTSETGPKVGFGAPDASSDDRLYLSGTTPAGSYTAYTLAASSVAAEGANQPHDNLMPFVVLTYIICTNGYFPNQA